MRHALVLLTALVSPLLFAANSKGETSRASEGRHATPIRTRPAPQSRVETVLPGDWKFMIVSPGEFSGKAPSDNSGWKTVSIPHCYGMEDRSLKDYHRGPAWYKRSIQIPETVQGRRFFLKFQAVSSVAEVYFNGERLGEHRGAFGAFAFEVTRFVKAGSDNLLEVHVTNEKAGDIAPLAGDFCIPGGIYRPVSLIETNETCFTPLNHGSPGLTVLQSKVAVDEAVLDIAAEVSFLAAKKGEKTERPDIFILKAFTDSDAKNSARRTLSIEIIDTAGKVVAKNESEIIIQPYVTPEYRRRIVVKNPHLWRGRIDPYLYRVVATVKNGTVEADRVEQSVGLRSIAMDPDKGFLLNGEVVKVKGVNRHQEREGKGWAISPEDEQQDLDLITEMGANAVRCAHYQHSDNFYSICDKAGVLVWAELPQVSEMGVGDDYETTTRNQLLDLIRQNINHTSIFAWSLFNEICPPTADAHRTISDMNKLAHAEDPTRPTIGAASHNWWPQMNSITDWLGFNTYPFWYGSDNPGGMYDTRRGIPRIPAFCISEYGAGASINQHKQITSNADWPVPAGPWHPEEWQTYCHRNLWAAISKRPFVWGSFAWVMFDFTSWKRKEGDREKINDKGLVTSDRKVKKDAFYFYKANWSDQPVAYIASRRHVHRGDATTPVRVLSNAEEVELSVNGKTIGIAKPDSLKSVEWANVKLAKGENTIKISARFKNGHRQIDSCVWEYVPGFKEEYAGKIGLDPAKWE